VVELWYVQKHEAKQVFGNFHLSLILDVVAIIFTPLLDRMLYINFVDYEQMDHLTTGCLELFPSIIFLLLMHPHIEKIDPDELIVDPDLPPPLSTSSVNNTIGNERFRLFGFLRRTDSGNSIRRSDGGGGAGMTTALKPGTSLSSSSGNMVANNNSFSNTPSSSSSNMKKQQHHETTALLKHTRGDSSGNAAMISAVSAIGATGYGSVIGPFSPPGVDTSITTPSVQATGDPTISPL
jgi:hypothetical protein